MEKFIYCYGMTVWSTIHKLKGPYPEADTYQEILETFNIPGGETGNTAVILSNLGYRVKIDGPFLGKATKDGILGFYERFNIDCTGLKYDESYPGVQDLVLVDHESRTVFGRFAHYFSSGEKKWNSPRREDVQMASIAAIDPFFGDESRLAAELCVQESVPYITIDCPAESFIYQNAAATVISKEFISKDLADKPIEKIYEQYAFASDQLVIFTFGGEKILFGKGGKDLIEVRPYQVEVKSTLGAGDTFRAGVLYGVLNGFDDLKTVQFAAATAAIVCSRFPMAYNPPKLEEILALIK